MGFGDDVIGSGFARGARARGRRLAFGNGKTIIWGPWSVEIFKGNPNIAPPGQEGASDLEWMSYYKGHRNYNRLGREGWIWNYKFKAPVGEIFFAKNELEFALQFPSDFVLIEPNLPLHKPISQNKDWGLVKYQAVTARLIADGIRVFQFAHGRDRLRGVRTISAPTFRHALAVLARASAAVLPEGGLHHGAAAVGVPATVIFGGCIPPQVLGYDSHINLTGVSEEACGKLSRCEHCSRALASISVDEVYAAVKGQLNERTHSARKALAK